MKKTMWMLFSLAVLLAPSLSWSAGEPSQAQPAQPSAAGDSNASPFIGGAPQAAQVPPADWTSLKGTVQAIDKSANVVQLKDDSGQLLKVSLDRKVRIEKDGQKMALSQIQMGDSVTLSRKNTSAQEEGSKTY